MSKTAKFIIALLLTILTLFLWSLYTSTKEYSILKKETAIQRVEIRLKKNSVLITNKQSLTAIDAAFKTMKDTSKFYGGVSDVSDLMSVYKSEGVVKVWILHSPYYGWLLSVGERKNFSSPYLFRLIDSLEKMGATFH